MDNEDKDLRQAGFPEGRYTNSFQVGHSAFEFVLDFGQSRHESKETQFHSRIITGPVFAKALADTLGQSIKQYEETFGMIPSERK
jgi:hypothetical protein